VRASQPIGKGAPRNLHASRAACAPVRAVLVQDTDLFVQRAMPVPTTRPLRLVELLQDKGAEVHLVEWLRWQAGLPDEEQLKGLHFHRFTMEVPRGALARARFLDRMNHRAADAIVALKPEGIVVANEEMLLACVRARKRLGGTVPVFYDSGEHFTAMVAEQHPLEAVGYGALQRYASRHLEHVFPAVDAVAEHWRRLGAKATTIYNSRESREIHPFMLDRAEAKRRLGLPPDSLVLGFLGSIHPDQGLATVVDALPSLPPRVRMVVLGGPEEERRKLMERAKQHGVGDRFTTQAPLPHEESIRFISAYDVGLLALTGKGPNFEERLPYKLFDYMALGIPVIASDYAELRRFAAEKVGFALLAGRGQPASVAEQVRRLESDDALRREMGRKGREAFDRDYSGERQKERVRATHAFWR
jgi:glycosyltransferase involved in cell wall biosynthesis